MTNLRVKFEIRSKFQSSKFETNYAYRDDAM
jgi:hypothetical protein